ncbi:MAG: glycosyltransferase family 39 protein [Candidatus Altiarchaeota archaeon]
MNDFEMDTNSGSDRKYLIMLAGVLLLSMLFRFYNLDIVPKWDFDEGYNMRYSYDLLNGEILWFSIKYTFIPHPPLFFMAYALVIKFFGVGISTIRILVALCGVATTIFVYMAGKEMFGQKVGVLAAFIYAVTPEVVFWNRIGYANNLFIMLSAMALYFTYRYSKTLNEKHLYLGCLSAGLSVITEYTGLFNVAAMAIFLYIYRRGKTLKIVLLSLTPMILVFAFMLYHSPEYFIFDLKYQTQRFLSPIKIVLFLFAMLLALKMRKRVADFYKPITETMSQDMLIYTSLVSLGILITTSERDFWYATTYIMLMGLFGICLKPSFLIEGEKERRLVLLFFLLNLASILLLNRADHMTMVIYPHAILGIAAMLSNIYEKSVEELPWILRRFRLKPSRRVIYIATFHSIFIALCFSTYMFLSGNISTESPDRDYAVAEYINQRTGEGDLILTYSWMFPLIKNARVSLLTQSLAYEGHPIAYYSGDFPKERFAFNTSYTRAKFIVASNGTTEWLLNQTGLNETVRYIDSWDKTYVEGFLVYSNPSYNNSMG